MNILDTIIAHKKIELEKARGLISIARLEARPLFSRETISLKHFLVQEDSTGIIAEFKRRSPSKGIINDKVSVEYVTKSYALHSSGISVLTDMEFFGGSLDDLVAARFNSVPLLRKDFMIDEYQVIEARANGADVILLIAACLSVTDVKKLARVARNLGLEVLLEIHNVSELAHICDEVDLIGVNNRNLQTFEVDIKTSMQLIGHIPSSKPAVTESGITDVETIVSLKQAGFKGFLIGENFMKHADPAIAFAEFIHRLKAIIPPSFRGGRRIHEN